MFDRLPPRDSDAWDSAPIKDVLRPLTSDYIGDCTVMHPDGEDLPEAQGEPKRRGGKRQPITPEQERRVVALARQHTPYKDIALRVGLGQCSVGEIARKHGVGLKRGRKPKPKTEPRWCAAPGCETPLWGHNTSGVCRAHRHGNWCGCTRCEGRG